MANENDKSVGDDLILGQNEASGVASGVPSKDVDEALRFLKAEGTNDDWNNINERDILRKIDWHVMPILFCVYFLQYTDKTLCKEAAASLQLRVFHLTHQNI